MIIHLDQPLPVGSSESTRKPRCGSHLETSEDVSRLLICSCFGWGLPSQRVTSLLVSFYLTFSPFPAPATPSSLPLSFWIGCPPKPWRRRTLYVLREARTRGLSFCGTFLRSPEAAVSSQPTLRSPDFPRIFTEVKIHDHLPYSSLLALLSGVRFRLFRDEEYSAATRAAH